MRELLTQCFRGYAAIAAVVAGFTGRPFEFYIGALAGWAAVSFGWVLGGMSVAGLTVVGYGWLAIAAYGLVVGIGIVINHKDDVATVVDPKDSLETDA